MITVIDYGAGNLKSVCNALAFLGVKSEVTGDADKVARADKLILPGVGAFGVCMEKLRSLSLDEAIKSAAGAGTPVLGICLGLQMLFDRSEEFGMHDGLGLLPGEVRRIKAGSLPLPHIAWTSVEVRGGRLMAGIKSGEFFYFESGKIHIGWEKTEPVTIRKFDSITFPKEVSTAWAENSIADIHNDYTLKENKNLKNTESFKIACFVQILTVLIKVTTFCRLILIPIKNNDYDK